MYFNVVVCALLIKNCLAEYDTKIINGMPADITDFPWTVSLRRADQHHCGGSIISENYVLTAAHCFRATTVEYGVDRVNPNSKSAIKILRFLKHEGYDPDRIKNDIALVELRHPIRLNGKTTKVVKLPKSYQEVSDNENVTAVGFGLINGNQFTGKLSKVTVQTISNWLCESAYQFMHPVYDMQICTEVTAERKGVCYGDSGSSLTQNDGTQVGIVSWSAPGCAIYPFPDVYTRVAHFIEWIEKKTGLKLGNEKNI